MSFQSPTIDDLSGEEPIKSELELYYRKTFEVTLNDEITKAFVDAAKKLAKQVVETYDMKQMIKHDVQGIDGRIIITTVFEKGDDERK